MIGNAEFHFSFQPAAISGQLSVDQLLALPLTIARAEWVDAIVGAVGSSLIVLPATRYPLLATRYSQSEFPKRAKKNAAGAAF